LTEGDAQTRLGKEINVPAESPIGRQHLFAGSESKDNTQHLKDGGGEKVARY
jgi:hypothetical protein